MTRISFSRVRKSIKDLLFPAFVLVGVGCSDSEIKTYRIAKEETTAKVPHVHSDDEEDGHHAPPPTAMAVPKISWETPKGWEALPPDGMRKAIFRVSGEKGEMAQVMVIPLPGVADIEAQSVNIWRQELGLKELTDDQVNQEAQAVQVGDSKGQLHELANTTTKTTPGQSGAVKLRTLGAIAKRDNVMWFAKMSGADEVVAAQRNAFTNFLNSLKFENPTEVAAAPAVSTNAKKLPAEDDLPQWKTPANWQQKAPGSMLLAAYTVTGAGQAEVTISKFPGTVGGVAANVNRWRKQLKLDEMPEAAAKQSTEALEIDGKKDSYLVDVKGTDSKTGRPARLVAIGVPRSGETWFYKLMGDEATVAGEKDAFLKFVVGAY